MTQKQTLNVFERSNMRLFRAVNLPPLTPNASAEVQQRPLSQLVPEIYTCMNHHNIYREKKRQGAIYWKAGGGREEGTRWTQWNQHHGESSDEPGLMLSRISIYISRHFIWKYLQIIQPVLKACLWRGFSIHLGLLWAAQCASDDFFWDENKCKYVLQPFYCCVQMHLQHKNRAISKSERAVALFLRLKASWSLQRRKNEASSLFFWHNLLPEALVGRLENPACNPAWCSYESKTVLKIKIPWQEQH